MPGSLSTGSDGPPARGGQTRSGEYARGVIVLSGVVLLLNAAFNVVAWPTFLRRVARHPRAHDAAGRATTILRVHAVLTAIALVLAAASLVLGVLLLT